MNGFPPGFVWGVSMSAYQIEGAVDADGRTPSVWDTFCGEPGRIADSSSGVPACDHHHRWKEDIELMAGLGVGAYRFSVSWSRVQPAGSGGVNTPGLDFYDRLVDGLLDAGIAPVANLYHWDLPQWLQDRGGWLAREVADRFGEYAAAVADRLGDRIGCWSTFNEIFEHTMLGHVTGTHAPGLTLPLDRALAVAHHQLLAHGIAARAIRASSAAPVLLINSYAPARPASDSPADLAATELYDVAQNRLCTDPVLLGTYPAELEPLIEAAGVVRDGDLAAIAGSIDGLGVNYYAVQAVRAAEDGPAPLEVEAPAGYPQTAFGWAVTPDGLTEVLTSLRDRYGDALPPLHVTENGCAYDDTLTEDGGCADPDRIGYLDAHIGAVRAAIESGVDVRGYYVWSLLDNFEWAEGYTKRFGLVYVDYPTQRRIPKSSYFWYRDLITR